MSGVFAIEIPPEKGKPCKISVLIRDLNGQVVRGWKNPKAICQRPGGKIQKLPDPVETKPGTGYVELTGKHTEAPHVVVTVSVSNPDAVQFVKLVTMRNED